MRSKYATYPEYHTSDDNMSFISPEGLFGGFEINRKCIEAIELNVNYQSSILGEPKMDKRGLRNTLGAPKVLPEVTKNIMNFLMYSDGSSLIDIADRIGLNIFEANEIAKILLKENLIFKI
jgi:aminopeptidase-like protein